MKRFCIPFLLAFFPTACPPTSPVAGCAAVCANMARLNCPSAKPTAYGQTCEQVCVNLQNSEIAKWNLDCRARAESCAAADDCER